MAITGFAPCVVTVVALGKDCDLTDTRYWPKCACGWEGTMDYANEYRAWVAADSHIDRSPSVRPDMSRSALARPIPADYGRSLCEEGVCDCDDE